MFEPPGRCYAYILADVCQCCFCIWQMSLPCFLWQMLLPLVCIFIGKYYCHILLADVIAMICILLSLWQMLLPLWLLVLPLVGMMYHSIADVMAIFRLMLVPCLNVAVFLADVITTMGDGIAIYENFVIGRCCLPGWQMQQPTRVGVWSDVITMCGRWNSH